MLRAYELLIEADENKINGEVYNAGWENKKVNDIALMVKKLLVMMLKLSKLKQTIIDHIIFLHKKSKKI